MFTAHCKNIYDIIYYQRILFLGLVCRDMCYGWKTVLWDRELTAFSLSDSLLLQLSLSLFSFSHSLLVFFQRNDLISQRVSPFPRAVGRFISLHLIKLLTLCALCHFPSLVTTSLCSPLCHEFFMNFLHI